MLIKKKYIDKMNNKLLTTSIISTVLAIITRYILGKEASGDILMWLFALAIICLALGIIKD